MATKTKRLTTKADNFKATDGFDWKIEGLKGSDTIVGAKGNDTIYGGKGNDRIDGLGGKNQLFGDVGNDTIYGGTAKATLNGGDGDDRLYASKKGSTLEGGKGADGFIAGAGKDIFVFKAGDSGNDAWEWDVVEGFELGKDKIDLTSMHGAQIQVIDAYGADTLIRIDSNADGVFDQSIQIVSAKLTASDVLI